MSSLFTNLGIDWKLLISQAVNFGILLVILRLTVYKPLLHFLHERRRKIEEGLQKAEEADRRFSQIGELQREKIREAEVKGVELITAAQARAKQEERQMLAIASAKEQQMIAAAQERVIAMESEARAQMEAEAAQLVKETLIKVVNVAPEHVDEALIAKALSRKGISS